MNNTELGFSAILAAFMALPAIAKISAELLEWMFSKIRLPKSRRHGNRAALE
jgi:hypothetical protein